MVEHHLGLLLVLSAMGLWHMTHLVCAVVVTERVATIRLMLDSGMVCHVLDTRVHRVCRWTRCVDCIARQCVVSWRVLL